MTAKVTVLAGQTVEVKERMKALPKPQPPFGRLRTIGADKFAAVYVNGKLMGHAGEFDNSVQGLLLNHGEYVAPIARFCRCRAAGGCRCQRRSGER